MLLTAGSRKPAPRAWANVPTHLFKVRQLPCQCGQLRRPATARCGRQLLQRSVCSLPLGCEILQESLHRLPGVCADLQVLQALGGAGCPLLLPLRQAS
jgi:hypothetical protein